MAERYLRIGRAGKDLLADRVEGRHVTASAGLARLRQKAHQNRTFTTAPNLRRAVAEGLASCRLGATRWKRPLPRSDLARCRRKAAISSSPIFRRWASTAIPVSAFCDQAGGLGHYVRVAFCKRAAVLGEAIIRPARHFRG